MTERASYWQRDAGWRDRWHATELPRRADLVVIGAGFAGLMTATRIRAQRPDASVALLEAERVGFGASGRNAGFLTPLAAPVWLLGAERSPEQAWAAARINAAVHEVARWIGAHVPACELAPATLALTATSRASDAALRELARAVDLVGLDHAVGTSKARPGRLVLTMDAYTMHPYRLAAGLAEHAATAGVTICERAAVRAVDGTTVRTARGTIDAGAVIVCTNAYTPTIELPERVRGTAVHSFMTASAPIDTASLVRDGDFTVEINTRQTYHRTHGDRVIYGGIDKLRAPAGGDFAVPPGALRTLGALQSASFGGASTPIEYAWSGMFHTTLTGLPIIRTATENPALFLNVAYGGTGVALSLACAPLAAGLATGTLTADDARLLAAITSTRISPVDAVRTLGRIAARFAMPWCR